MPAFLKAPSRASLLFFAGGAILGGALGCALSVSMIRAAPPAGSATREGGYQFVNPLLSCDINEDTEYAGYAPLKQKLQDAVNALVANGKVKRLSVYFRDMNNGAWTGVSPDDEYIPASLMKVPLMVAYLHESQRDATLLSKSLQISQAIDRNETETIKPAHPLALDSNYSIQTLIDAMIIESDNNAATVLNEAVATTSINDAYDQLGIPPADENSDSMSTKAYMRVFRILYNASYLSRINSQNALKLLTEIEFKDGIMAGVPTGTPVAHKFGERTIFEEIASKNSVVKKRELHDCGIVYYPRSPYGICIMTEGQNFDDLKAAIASVSKIIYSEVDKGLIRSANQ